MTHQISGSEFARAIHSPRGLRTVVAVTGFVRKAAEEANVEFSPPESHCLQWISIPVRLIDKVDVIDKRECHGELRDYVILYLKTPENADALVLFDLYPYRACGCSETSGDDGSSKFLKFFLRRIVDRWGIYLNNTNPSRSIDADVIVRCDSSSPPHPYNVTVGPNQTPLVVQCGEALPAELQIVDSHFV
jgi:hypothetical protein